MLGDHEIEKHFPERETVLLRFNKKDSQIALGWQKSESKDVSDDKI